MDEHISEKYGLFYLILNHADMGYFMFSLNVFHVY